MSSMKRVKAGDALEIPARTWNTFIDVAQEYKKRQLSRESQPKVETRDADIISVRNDAGVDVDRYSVLGIDQPLFGPADALDTFKNRVLLRCVTPLVSDHLGRFVITAEPIAAGKIGRAYIAGACLARIDVADDVLITAADVKDGSVQALAPGSGAAAVLWREAGTGLKWSVLRFGGGGGGPTNLTLAVITQSAGVQPWCYDLRCKLVDESGSPIGSEVSVYTFRYGIDTSPKLMECAPSVDKDDIIAVFRWNGDWYCAWPFQQVDNACYNPDIKDLTAFCADSLGVFPPP